LTPKRGDRFVLFINDDPVDVRVRSADRDDKGRLLRGGKKQLSAKFQRGAAPGYARKIGAETFVMTTRPPEVAAEDWLSAFDSNAAQEQWGWTDDERELVEQRLLEQRYLAVEPPKVEAPYPRYVEHRKVHGQRKIEHAIKDIVAAYEATGFDVDAAIAFERQEGNSDAVVAALEGLKDAGGVGETEQVITA
jgi:hypothetical protein